MAITTVPVAGNPGMSMALRLENLPGFELYEGNIVGGGDLVLMAASLGALDELFLHRTYAPAHQADIRAWAQRCVQARETLPYADNLLLHLWHGTMAGRQYGQRLGILPKCGYDPQRDVDRSGDPLQFAAGAEEVKAAVGAYLASRDDA